VRPGDVAEAAEIGSEITDFSSLKFGLRWPRNARCGAVVI
jgi:hypothetical protein